MNDLTIKETTVLTILYNAKNSDSYLFGKEIALTKQYKKLYIKQKVRNHSYVCSCILILRRLIQKNLISFIEDLSSYGASIRKYKINEIGIKEIERMMISE